MTIAYTLYKNDKTCSDSINLEWIKTKAKPAHKSFSDPCAKFFVLPRHI